MSIHWSLPMLKSLLPEELFARMRTVQANPHIEYKNEVMRLYNGNDGKILKEIPTPGVIRVSRKKLRALCSEGLDVIVSNGSLDVS
jgi:hypothetical protein